MKHVWSERDGINKWHPKSFKFTGKKVRKRERRRRKEEMVRTPSCDKNGLKKGTWTAEEDRKLTAYVTRYGCWNWRQLPKFAGNYIIKIFSGNSYYF